MNKTAIITGASGGIGAATAISLAKEGYDLLICGNSSEAKLEQVQKKCLCYTKKCLSFTGDAAKSETARLITQTAMQAFNRIDTLIHCTGISHIGLITDMTDNDWFQIVNTNLSSAFFMCRQVIPHMVHKKSGRIITVSSIWGTRGASCEAAYSATKGGLNTLTKALAKELAPSGISANAVACGMIDTKMNSCFSKEEIEQICEEIPAGRMASPEETADFITLLTKAPAYLTGQVIGFDGGW